MARQGSGHSSATASNSEPYHNMIRRNPERYGRFANNGPGGPGAQVASWADNRIYEISP